MTSERRQHERTKGHIRIGYGQNEIVISDLSSDLSVKGTFVRTPYPLDIDTPLQVEIQYQGKANTEPKLIRLQARVTRVDHDKDNPGMAIEFLNLSESDQKQIKSLMKLLAKEK